MEIVSGTTSGHAGQTVQQEAHAKPACSQMGRSWRCMPRLLNHTGGPTWRYRSPAAAGTEGIGSARFTMRRLPVPTISLKALCRQSEAAQLVSARVTLDLKPTKEYKGSP